MRDFHTHKNCRYRWCRLTRWKKFLRWHCKPDFASTNTTGLYSLTGQKAHTGRKILNLDLRGSGSKIRTGWSVTFGFLPGSIIPEFKVVESKPKGILSVMIDENAGLAYSTPGPYGGGGKGHSYHHFKFWQKSNFLHFYCIVYIINQTKKKMIKLKFKDYPHLI